MKGAYLMYILLYVWIGFFRIHSFESIKMKSETITNEASSKELDLRWSRNNWTVNNLGNFKNCFSNDLQEYDIKIQEDNSYAHIYHFIIANGGFLR